MTLWTAARQAPPSSTISGVCSNTCPLSWWCYLTTSSSAAPFSFSFSLSQNQGLFQWVSSSHQMAKVLELQLQHKYFQGWFPDIQGWFPLGLTGLISLQSEGLSVVFSSIRIRKHLLIFSSVQFSSVQSLSRVRLCDPMNCSTPGLPVHHQLPEFTQTHVHRGGDAIQPSHPLSSPSPPALNPSEH